MSLVSSQNNAPRANRQPIIFDEQIAEQEAMLKQEPKQKAPPQIVTNQFFYSNNSGNLESNSPVHEDSAPMAESANYTSTGSPAKRK
jgi:hypothetical protein